MHDCRRAIDETHASPPVDSCPPHQSTVESEHSRAILVNTKLLNDAVGAQPMLLAAVRPRLGLLWSAKAGCTFAVKWFLYQADLLQAATFYHPWVHQYRGQVFYRSTGYAEAIAHPNFFEFPFVKFVRDPHERCVSAYLAFCHAAHTQRDGEHKSLLAAIEASVGRSIGTGSTFTFREFVSLLHSFDLDHCDIHIRRQTHPLERLGVLQRLQVLRLEDSEQKLPELERRLDLRSSDFAQLRYSPHHVSKADVDGCFADTPFFDTVSDPMPAGRNFYDGALRESVAKLYSEDIQRYGY